MRSKTVLLLVVAVLSFLSVPSFAQVIPSSSGNIQTFKHFVNNVETQVFDVGDNIMIRSTAFIEVDATAPELGVFVLDVQIYTLRGGAIAAGSDNAVIGAGMSQVMIEDANKVIVNALPDRYHTSTALAVVDAQSNVHLLDADQGQFRLRGGRK